MRRISNIPYLALFVSLALASGTLAAENGGFTPLFDGKTFEGWNGNQEVFRIEDGAIVGGSLKERVKHNEFLTAIGQYGDFELRLQFKLLGKGVNAGVQVRSDAIEPATF